MYVFHVYGKPSPKGSYAPVTFERGDGSTGIYLKPQTKRALTEWVKSVQLALHGFTRIPKGKGVIIRLEFYFQRPMSHFTTKGRRTEAPFAYTKTPDVDKLARTVLDAMKGIVFDDDSQVVALLVTKAWLDAGVCELKMQGMIVRIEEDHIDRYR